MVVAQPFFYPGLQNAGTLVIDQIRGDASQNSHNENKKKTCDDVPFHGQVPDTSGEGGAVPELSRAARVPGPIGFPFLQLGAVSIVFTFPEFVRMLKEP
jgi:hypothetical protein